jgi:hypothetical protein
MECTSLYRNGDAEEAGVTTEQAALALKKNK